MNSPPGVLQAAFLFAGTLGLYRSFAPETEAMAIHGLMLGPVDRAAIYFGKLASGTLLLLAVEIPVVPALRTLFSGRTFWAASPYPVC